MDRSTLSVPLLKQEGKALMKAKDWWNGAKGLGLVQDGRVEFTNEPEPLTFPGLLQFS
jgi:methionyl-tRNA formyltransferase